MRGPTGHKPTSAKSNIFTSGIKKLIFLPRQAASNGLFEPRWICRGLERLRGANKLSTNPPGSSLGTTTPWQATPLPGCFVLAGFPPPLCHKLSQFFCPPACSTIIYLAIQDETERGFIFAGSFHLFAVFAPHTFQAISTLLSQDTFLSKGVTFRRTIHTWKKKWLFPPLLQARAIIAYHKYSPSSAHCKQCILTGYYPPSQQKLKKKRQVEESFQNQTRECRHFCIWAFFFSCSTQLF